MTYSKRDFASDLDRLVAPAVVDYSRLATWAYETRLQNLRDIDADVSKWLMELGAMDMGAEFQLSPKDLAGLVERARQR